MARSRLILHNVLVGLEDVVQAYFQPDQNTSMVYPCIVYERDDSYVAPADNIKYRFMKRYQVTVIDRDPDSLIPDQVEALPYSRFDRRFTTEGLNHNVFNLFF